MKRLAILIYMMTILLASLKAQIGSFNKLYSDSVFSRDYRFRSLPNYSIYNALTSITSGDQNLSTPPGTTTQRPTVPSGKIILRFNTDSNALEYGNSSQIWKTLTTGSVQIFDTSSIPNFYLKVRSLLSASSPLQYNAITGNLILPPATSTQSGYLSASDWVVFNSRLPDPGSNGLVTRTASGITAARQLIAASANISIVNPSGVSGNPSIDINDTLLLKQVQLPYIPASLSAADSALFLNRSTGLLEVRALNGGGINNTNIGSGYRLVNSFTQTLRTLYPGFGLKIDSTLNSNGLTFIVDTSSTGLPSKHYIDSSVTSVMGNNGVTKIGSTIQLGQTIGASGDPAALSSSREIPLNSLNLVVTGTGSVGIGTNAPNAFVKLDVLTTGLISGVRSTAASGAAFNGTSNLTAIIGQSLGANIGVNGMSNGGYGVVGSGGIGGIGGRFYTIAQGNTPDLVSLELERLPTGTGVTDGVGQTIMFRLPYNNGSTGNESGRIKNYFSSASPVTPSSNFSFHLINAGVSARKALLAYSGQWTWDGYTGSNFQTIDTSLPTLVVDISGNIFKRAGGNGGGGGSATLNNIGAGHRLVATSGGNVKTVFGSNTIAIDSVSNSNALTFKVDTTVIATQYKLSLKPKVYNILEFGAIPDGMENYTASMTGGSATLTCTTCGFSVLDIGKWIRIYRAGSSAIDLVTTITGFTNSTTVTLNTTAGNSVSADTVIYGTDNVPAIQSALNAANVGGGDARVVIPPPGNGKFYVLAGTLNHSGSDCNCQINFPISDISDSSFNKRKNIIIDGLVAPNHTPSALFSDTTTPKMNTTLVSIIHGSGTRPSVFASKANSFLYANYINYNLITVKNLALLVDRNRSGGGPDIGGFNFFNASSSPMENVLVSWNGPIHSTTQPTNEVAGVIAGQLSSEIYTTLKNVSVFGFKFGVVVTESVSLDHVIAHACVNGITLIHGNYPVVGGYVDAHWCKNSVYVPASTILGDIAPGLTYFNFQNLAIEIFNGSSLGAPSWINYTNIISDSSSFGRGNIYGYTIGHAEVGIDNSMFSKYGGDSIFVYQTGSAVDRNSHIYAGLTKYAGWQNGGLTNYWYNWSPLNDVSIMRLSPTAAGSQALYLSPNSTGGSGGVPKSWINLFNTALWTGVNTTSSNTEVLQIAATGTAGYNITSSQSGTGVLRDINIGNGTLPTQLVIGANGSNSINTTNTDALVINGNNSARGSILINNANAAGSASLYIKNNLGFNAYGGMLTGGASDAGSSLFGLSRPDRTFIIHDGTNGAGMGIGTLINQPLVLGTNNTARINIAGTGAITFNGAFTFPTADGSANQVLQTNGSGTVSWVTPSHGDLQIINDVNYTVLSTDGAIRYQAILTADRTVTLPAAASFPQREIWVKWNQLGGHSIFVASSSSIYFDGTANSTAYASNVDFFTVCLKSDGTSWYRIN